MSTRSESAWSSFWAKGGSGAGSGCLPNARSEIEAVLNRTWAQVARPLPRNAPVLDLATGDGAVLEMISRARRDLKLFGIDSAASLPRTPRGATVKAGVAMEQLPFAAAKFDLATSQFGIEYGDVAAASRELARVLRPTGRIAFVVHHADGPILLHNAPRRAALEWAIDGSGMLPRARSLVQARAIGPLPTPASFAEGLADARRRFPQQPVACEFLTAILQTLDLSRRGTVQQALSTLAELEERGRNEIARIRALEAAAQSADGIGLMRHALLATGVCCADPRELTEASGARAFAWLLEGHRQP